MSSKLDLAGLQKELLKIAEKEAQRKPDIRKDHLKKKIREQVFPTEVAARILPEGMIKTIDSAIDAVVEMAVTMARLGMDAPVAKSAPAKNAKKKGKPRRKRGKSMAVTVEEMMAKRGVKQMKVVDIKQELLKKTENKGKEKKLYTLITIALNQSKRFEKAGPGEYKLAKK